MKKTILFLFVSATGILTYAGDSSIYLCSQRNAAATGGEGSTYAAYVVNSRASWTAGARQESVSLPI